MTTRAPSTWVHPAALQHASHAADLGHSVASAEQPPMAPPQRRVAFTGMPPDVDRAMADVAGLMRQRGAAAMPVNAGFNASAPPQSQDPRVAAAMPARPLR